MKIFLILFLTLSLNSFGQDIILNDSLSFTLLDSVKLKFPEQEIDSLHKDNAAIPRVLYSYGDSIYCLDNEIKCIIVFDMQGNCSRLIKLRKYIDKEGYYMIDKKHPTLSAEGLCISKNYFIIYDAYGWFDFFSRGGEFIRQVKIKEAKFNKQRYRVTSYGNKPQLVEDKNLIILPVHRKVNNKMNALNQDFYLNSKRLGIFDFEGNLINVFGEYDSVYNTMLLAHLSGLSYFFDSNSNHIYLSQEATPAISVYDLNGNIQSVFGEGGHAEGRYALHAYKRDKTGRSNNKELYITDPFYFLNHWDAYHHLIFMLYMTGEPYDTAVNKSPPKPAGVCEMFPLKQNNACLKVYKQVKDNSYVLVSDQRLKQRTISIVAQNEDIFWMLKIPALFFSDKYDEWILYKYKLITKPKSL